MREFDDERRIEESQLADPILPKAFLRMCRRNMFRPKIVDSTGMAMSGGGLLLKSLVLRRLLLREVLRPEEHYVGVLLPPSVAGVVVNAAVPLCGRVAVNLNYTLPPALIDSCIAQCGIKHVLTSRRVMSRLKLDIDAELVYLEDFAPKVTWRDKLAGLCGAYLTPKWLLDRMCGLHRLHPDDLLTVIFTSGTTGEPKGVMLTHTNVGSNIAAIDGIVHLRTDDAIVGVLPFFHSFGYTCTLWPVLAFDVRGAYHFSPLEPDHVGEVCRRHKGTILVGTPTFLRMYLKRCPPEDFASLDVVVAGAEKLTSSLADAFEKKFGVRPVEGYGATELSPLAAVNIPPSRARVVGQRVHKEGTVGRPIPNVEARVVHPETSAVLGTGAAGVLEMRGPNVMLGYLNKPELTTAVKHDGWYVTGDIAEIDAEGFIRITGRESRFSKIGGEMVPHLLIEETLQRVLGCGEDELTAVVTAVPDPIKGERLVVLHTGGLGKTPDAIRHDLAAAGLPPLWIPARHSFAEVEAIPVLGTGKLDLKAVQNLAAERFAATAASVE